MAQEVRSLPAMQETQVRSLDWEDSPGEGNGNPLQYSRLEDPMDGGAWRATFHGVLIAGHGLSLAMASRGSSLVVEHQL